ncbi:hypothetical protein AKN90_00635 [Thiopseudomonas alkaliphila]|nr:hypothetical protein AKN90_00635 [Thiopseudomonas alkaliphila]
MIRVHVICEGQTEEMFVKELLQPEFSAKSIYLNPMLVGKPGHKGGNFKFERLLTDVRNHLLSDRSSYCTTFFDFYGLPASFSGKSVATNLADIESKAETVRAALCQALAEKLGEEVMRRFIPFVQMYEFEALLFSDPAAFAKGIDREHLIQSLTKIAEQFVSPEHINNSPQTAPSKRIEALISDYEKPLMGTLAALEVGIRVMREKCLLFNAWLTQLEQLSAPM